MSDKVKAGSQSGKSEKLSAKAPHVSQSLSSADLDQALEVQTVAGNLALQRRPPSGHHGSGWESGW